jgi:hypothetical protein
LVVTPQTLLRCTASWCEGLATSALKRSLLRPIEHHLFHAEVMLATVRLKAPE